MTDFVVGQKEICFYVTVKCEIPTTQITYLKHGKIMFYLNCKTNTLCYLLQQKSDLSALIRYFILV